MSMTITFRDTHNITLDELVGEFPNSKAAQELKALQSPNEVSSDHEASISEYLRDLDSWIPKLLEQRQFDPRHNSHMQNLLDLRQYLSTLPTYSPETDLPEGTMTMNNRDRLVKEMNLMDDLLHLPNNDDMDTLAFRHHVWPQWLKVVTQARDLRLEHDQLREDKAELLECLGQWAADGCVEAERLINKHREQSHD